MERGKRVLEAGCEGKQVESKRQKVPALSRIIVEALNVDCIRRLCVSLEPIIRKAVREELECALPKKLRPFMVGSRSLPKRIGGPEDRKLQLRFQTSLSLPLFTGVKVKGEQGAAVHVVLIDANSGDRVTSGPESCLKLDVVALEGDFKYEDGDDWTQEEFESYIVKEREGKRPLLVGDLQVTLREGVGMLGELIFTDNSSWVKCKKFRLGVRVASGTYEGIHIREAKTEAFPVKDRRGELYQKHHPPALSDDIWRLEKIGKDGSFHKRLNEAGIHTVEDLLKLAVRDSQSLRNILGNGMSNKMWDVLMEHAKTCVLSGKNYVYYADNMKSTGVTFNEIYKPQGLIAGGQYYPVEILRDNQKQVLVGVLVKNAYDDWTHIIEYDGKMLLNMKQSEEACSSSSNVPLPAENPLHVEQAPVNPGLAARGTVGYDDNFGNHSNGQIQFQSSTFVQQVQFANSYHTQNAGTDSTLFQSVFPSSFPPNSSLYDHESSGHHNIGEINEFFSEGELFLRRNEMHQNDDWEPSYFSMAGAPVNTYNDGYCYSSYMQPPSGKAFVGWLKLKAALRWGIFMKKIVAEKRAQLVELEGCMVSC